MSKPHLKWSATRKNSVQSLALTLKTMGERQVVLKQLREHIPDKKRFRELCEKVRISPDRFSTSMATSLADIGANEITLMLRWYNILRGKDVAQHYMGMPYKWVPDETWGKGWTTWQDIVAKFPIGGPSVKIGNSSLAVDYLLTLVDPRDKKFFAELSGSPNLQEQWAIDMFEDSVYGEIKTWGDLSYMGCEHLGASLTIALIDRLRQGSREPALVGG